MSQKELVIFLHSLKGQSESLYALALVQALQIMRVSEVAAMKWANVNFDEKNYTVREHVRWNRITGEVPEIVGGTKTLKPGMRYVSPLRRDAVEILKVLYEHLVANGRKEDFEGLV